MDNLGLESAWAGVVERVKEYPEVSAPQVDAMFARLHPQALSEGFLMLTADNDFIKKHIETHFVRFIQRALEEPSGVPHTVLIEVDEPAQPSAAAPLYQTYPSGVPAAVPTAAAVPQQGSYPQPAVPNPGTYPAPAAIPVAGAAGYDAPEGPAAGAPFPAVQPYAAPGQQPFRANLPAEADFEETFISDVAPAMGDEGEDAAHDGHTNTQTFENFVVGDSNNLAYNMAVEVAEQPGKEASNPLFIYGKSGLGKTHLMRAIQNYINECMPGMKTVYVDSSELVDDYMQAGAERDREKTSYKLFKARYESADVLLIDDVQFLQGKTQTLEIVFQMFNKLVDRGKQVILSADRAPKNIDMDERYKTRFNKGMTCDIQPPTVETKLGIILNFLDSIPDGESGCGARLPKEIQSYIAEISGSNIRELKSAVTKVLSWMNTFHKSDITVGDVRSLLEAHFSSGPSRRVTIPDVQREVESFYKISHADLIGKKRSRSIAHARHVAIYLCREMIDLPYGDIGKQFGGRDHTTILYSCRTVEEKIREDRFLYEEVEGLRKNIREV